MFQCKDTSETASGVKIACLKSSYKADNTLLIVEQSVCLSPSQKHKRLLLDHFKSTAKRPAYSSSSFWLHCSTFLKHRAVIMSPSSDRLHYSNCYPSFNDCAPVLLVASGIPWEGAVLSSFHQPGLRLWRASVLFGKTMGRDSADCSGEPKIIEWKLSMGGLDGRDEVLWDSLAGGGSL